MFKMPIENRNDSVSRSETLPGVKSRRYKYTYIHMYMLTSVLTFFSRYFYEQRGSAVHHTKWGTLQQLFSLILIHKEQENVNEPSPQLHQLLCPPVSLQQLQRYIHCKMKAFLIKAVNLRRRDKDTLHRCHQQDGCCGGRLSF